jgi:hypothetical protein
VRDDGARLAFGSVAEQHIRPGRYFAAVSGRGSYSLRLALKAITTASLRVDGRHSATIRPDAVARLSLRVQPRVAGQSLFTVERFDPISGWQFLRTYHPRVSHGSAQVRFRPPSVGRYRVFASYLGSRDAAPADTGVVRLLVQRPLGQPRGQGSSRTTVSATQAGLA